MRWLAHCLSGVIPLAASPPGHSLRFCPGHPDFGLMRVKEIAAQDKDSNGIVSYAYDYDRMDNIKNKNTEHGNYDYDYDDLYRLTDVDNPTIDDEGFGYDPVGNRLTLGGTDISRAAGLSVLCASATRGIDNAFQFFLEVSLL
jgi:hypothetical protein